VNSAWTKWVLDNLLRGVSADDLYLTMVRQGFVHDEIVPLLGNNLSAQQRKTFEQRYGVKVPQPQFLSGGNLAYEQFTTDGFTLYLVPNYIPAQLCQETVLSIRRGLRPSTITTVPEGQVQDFRTSSTCDLATFDAPLSERISTPLSALLGGVHDTSEPLQAQHYAVGQEFKAHTDYFEPGSNEFKTFAGPRGQRSWTCMIYLNTVKKGGETEFPYLQQKFTPREGDALVWCSVHPDGRVNPKSLHQAHPVLEGEKFVITQWCRLPAAV